MGKRVRFNPETKITIIDIDRTQDGQTTGDTTQDGQMTGDTTPTRQTEHDRSTTKVPAATHNTPEAVGGKKGDGMHDGEGNPPNTGDGNTNRKKQKRKRIRKNKNLQLAVINIRGAKGKMKSLEAILKTEKTTIAAICETHLKNNETVNISGYKWIGRNRKNKQGGGVGILIANQIAGITTTREEIENEHTEGVWIEIKTRPTPTFVGVFYGPQENNTKEETERTYSTLEAQIHALRTEGEVVLAGDFNAKLEITNEKITQSISKNGKILKTMMENQELQALNTNPQEGGWTRVNRRNTEEKSVIDYILATKDIAKRCENIIVDEEGALRIKGKNESDHNTITATIRVNTPRKPTYIRKWNIKNNEGWKKFNDEITKNAGNIKEYTQFEKALTETLKNTIGETKIRTDKPRKSNNDEIKNKRQRMKSTRQRFEEACKTGSPQTKQKTKEEYIRARKELREETELDDQKRLEETIKKVVEEAKKNPNVIWDLRRKTSANNTLEYDIMDEEGKYIKDPGKAKEHIAGYFQDLYQARPGTTEYEEWTEHITKRVKQTISQYENSGNKEGEPITLKELNATIKKLKRNKSTGPDRIPNEVFIEANQNTIHLFKNLLNDIYQMEKIPEQWQKGEIIRLYKGKGTKGKCSNERGITLASNVGKVFERIINNRIKPKIDITEAQAGGKEGAATADHLTTLKEIITHIRKMKKTAYIIFLDVQKAYDKAWLDAIMYVLNKNWLEGKDWEITRKLNTNLRATIRTKHGNTREIQIKDSIRQGGVLSVIQYATIIDEIAKEINRKNLGIEIPGMGKQGCLLWMDDVALIHHDLTELQKMMDTTNDIAQRYHIEFGAPKCKVIKIGPGKQSTIKIGNNTLEETTEYKYLGEILNNKPNHQNHIEAIKGKVNGAYNNIIMWTGNKEFKGIRMKAIWKLVEACIIPIMTYGTEAAQHTKQEMETMQQIFNNLLKKILDLPQSTPNSALLKETGFLPIEMYIDRKKLMQEKRIRDSKKDSLVKRITQRENSKWRTMIEETQGKYNIMESDMELPKESLKSKIILNQEQAFKDNITAESENKSKIKYILEHSKETKIGKRPKYIETLNRKECRAIVQARTRMIPAKNNHKGSYKDLKCRWCQTEGSIESQEHILMECDPIKSQSTINIEYLDIFQDQDINKLKRAAAKIMETLQYTQQDHPDKEKTRAMPQLRQNNTST